MNVYDYITHYGIQWGTYPYYQGDKYDKLGVYFGSFGSKVGIPYGAVKDNPPFAFTSDEGSQYLSMFRNGGLKEYYGDGLFKKKDSLVSKDDFIRKTEPIFAIPTEKELKELLENSNMHVTIGPNGQIFLIIEPYEKKDDGKKIIGSIYIPLLGCVNYNGDYRDADRITEYTTYNSEIKYLGYGDVFDIQKNSTQNPPEGYIYYEDKGNFNRYYEYYHTYSDVFLLTSDIPKDDNGEFLKQPDELGCTYARVLKITLTPKTTDFDSNDEDTSADDVEFLTFEITGWGFENRVCGYGTSEHKDTAYMVLPIRYDGNININVNGELFIDNHAFSTFNQNANKEDIPYVEIQPFGIPEIIDGKYNYTFFKNISDDENKLSTYFKFPNGTTDGMSYFSKIEYLDTTRVKITDTDKGDTYWILSNNDCLYFYSEGQQKHMVFDDRNFFGSKDKLTTINISINFNYNSSYIIPDTRFVLPSIYKPFYIKRLYCIEPYYYEYDNKFTCMYSFASHTNVYNGIGLFAHKGSAGSQQVPTVYSNFNENNVITNEPLNNVTNNFNGNGGIANGPLHNVTNNFISIGGKTNGNAVNDLPSELKVLLNSYFDGDNAFSKEYTYFYDIFKTEDMYAIGLLNDTIEVRNSNDETIVSIQTPLPIFRTKPLILSDYNDSVYDFFEHTTYHEYNKLNKNQTNIYVGNEFTSVMEPNTKLKFNDEPTRNYRLNFGELFDKIHFAECNPNTPDDGYPKCIDNFDSVVDILNSTSHYKKGIRYYFVNQAFYDNYIINNWEEETSEFIDYKQEYYNNREYYDLNPHKVDFKHSNIWNSSLGELTYEPEMKGFCGYPEHLYGLITTALTDNVIMVVDNVIITTYNISATSVSKELYYAYLPINIPDEEVNFSQYYSMSFWIQNTDMATISIRATLANKIGVNSFSTQEEEDNDLAPYKTIVIGTNERKYVTIQGYPFSGSSTIGLYIRPKYKNVDTNEYYKISFKISQVELREVKKYIPFFDMIPSLRNTKGYIYSDGGDFPNHNAPIALELYLSDDKKMLYFHPNLDCSNGSDIVDSISDYKPLYLIGASTPLTRLEGSCTDPESAYVKHIKDNTELLPQINSTSIIYSYGKVADKVCQGYGK